MTTGNHMPDNNQTSQNNELPRSGTTRKANTNTRMSDLLRQLAATGDSHIALGQITMTLKDRGFGAMLALLALPNLLPTIPGTSTIFGLPMILIAGQLLLGYRRPFLTRGMRHRQISTDRFRKILHRAEPWIAHYEKLTRPRFWPLSQKTAEKIIAAAIVLMGAVLVLPIPFGNFLPGIAVVLMSMGLIARDGLWTLAGLAFALAALAITVAVIATAGLAALAIF
jgi:hypothetical protein